MIKNGRFAAVVGGNVVYDDLDGRSADYWKAGMP